MKRLYIDYNNNNRNNNNGRVFSVFITKQALSVNRIKYLVLSCLSIQHWNTILFSYPILVRSTTFLKRIENLL